MNFLGESRSDFFGCFVIGHPDYTFEFANESSNPVAVELDLSDEANRDVVARCVPSQVT